MTPLVDRHHAPPVAHVRHELPDIAKLEGFATERATRIFEALSLHCGPVAACTINPELFTHSRRIAQPLPSEQKGVR